MSVVDNRSSAPQLVAAAQLAQADQPAVATIHIHQMKFEVPPGFSVKPGQRVDFVNDDPRAHTVTARNTNAAGDPLFDITVEPHTTGSITFTAEMIGAQPFYCQFHPHMTGTINVQADAAAVNADVLQGPVRALPTVAVQSSSLAIGLSAPNSKVTSARVRIGA